MLPLIDLISDAKHLHYRVSITWTVVARGRNSGSLSLQSPQLIQPSSLWLSQREFTMFGGNGHNKANVMALGRQPWSSSRDMTGIVIPIALNFGYLQSRMSRVTVRRSDFSA